MSSIKKKKLCKLTLLILWAEQDENQMSNILNQEVSYQISQLQLTEESEIKSQIGLI